MVEEILTFLITGLVYVAVAVLLAAIVAVNGYAFLHAWRHDRVGWAILIAVLFFTGGWLATAIYLILHWSEPLPRARPRRRLGHVWR
jgi:ABC-type arginine/histidine transport system permease subunit